MFKIWSIEHSAWWKADERGYTTNIDEAGLYDVVTASSICLSAGYSNGVPDEMMYPAY